MSYPEKYTRQYDYVSYQNGNPTRPLPADKLHADLNLIARTSTETVDFLKGFARADGALANYSVGIEQLSPALQDVFSGLPTGVSIGGTQYETKSAVETIGISSPQLYVRTAGFNVPGIGGALYVRVSSEPAHAGKIQTHDGSGGTVWLEIAEARLHVAMFGTAEDETSLEQSAIEDAIGAAAALGRPLHFSQIIYDVAADQSEVILGATRHFALSLPDNLPLELIGGPGTRLRMADGQSTDAAPRDCGFFVTSGTPKRVVMRNIIFDGNGDNNHISPSRASHVYNVFASAAINITGDAAWVDGLYLFDCQFWNLPGQSCVVLGQHTNAYAGPLSQNVHIVRPIYLNNHKEAGDASSLYAWAENVWETGATYYMDPAIDATGKNWVAWEIHGDNQFYTGATVTGYYRMFWQSSNHTNPVKRVQVSGCTARVRSQGPSFYREEAWLTSISGYDFFDNHITITADAAPAAIKAGVEAVTDYGIGYGRIHDNTFVFEGTGYNSAGLYLGVTDDDEVISNLLTGAAKALRTTDGMAWENNTVINAVTGIYARVNVGDGWLNNIIDRGNTNINLGATDPTQISDGSRFQAGDSNIGTIVSTGNCNYCWDGTTNFDNGLRIIGTIGQATVYGNEYRGMVNYPGSSPWSIDTSLATIALRYGLQLGERQYIPVDIALGHPTDTILARSAAGRVSVNGSNLVTAASTDALTNKTYNGMTVTVTTGTLTMANGKTLTFSNTLTFTGTDGSSVAFGTGGTVAYTSGTLAQFAATTSAQLAGVISDETGSAGGGVLVFNRFPNLIGPVFQDGSDNTKQMQFVLTGIATGTTRNWTFPNSDDTFVGVIAPQTLSNKGISGSTNTISNLATSMFAANVVDDDVSMAANSATRLPTQHAAKTYTDNAIAAYVAAQDVMVFKTVIDCSANPNYPAADKGWTYRVSVAGKIGGASGVNVEIGDMLLCLTDSTASGNQATVGANWSITQVNIDGAVVGPASAVDGTPMVADGITGKLIKNITYAAFKTLLVLVKGDVGLGSVDNTADSAKSVASAATLTTARNIDGQSFNGSANITVIGPATHAATTKTTPVDADELPLADSAASFGLKNLTWANLKATLKTYFDTFYALSGAYTTVTYSAGNFTANGAMTWTVDVGDQSTFGYMVIGKRMTIWLKLDATSVGGTVNTSLIFAIPGGFLAAARVVDKVAELFDNSTTTPIHGYFDTLAAGSSTIAIRKGDLTNFTLSTNQTYVYGCVTFPIQ